MDLENLEQKPPNQPNYTLLLISIAAAMLVFFALALWIAHALGNHHPVAKKTSDAMLAWSDCLHSPA